MVYCVNMVGKEFIVKLWRWFDNSFLLFATAFLLAFIPLYPKIPLGELIPGYIVRFRLEDILIGIVFAWWGIQVLRRKVPWKTPFTVFMVAYLVIGLLSNILGVVFTKSIPASSLHFGKSMLHWFRYIEYFSLFFLAYTSVRNKKDGFRMLTVIGATVIGIVVYGYGQKYLYWPVYSTMNREFSKGIRLYLGDFARVQSTFAGHYDLGAYLVIVLPIVLGLFFALRTNGIKDKREMMLRRSGRVLFGTAWIGGLWLLVLSASRASYGAYVVGISAMIAILMLKRGWRWGFTRGFVVLAISGIMMLLVGDLTTRFAQLIDQNKYPNIHRTFHQVNDYANHPLKLIGYNYEVKKPENAISVAELEEQLNESGLTVTDTQPTTSRPQDVYTDVPEEVYELGDPAATLAGALVEQDGKLVKERTFSDCALERSLSLCIRFETLWPLAIQGFQRNPLFGSGYATLNKTSLEQFTEAESTDNNFLRTLGENGLLGFFFYYGLSGLALWYAWLAFRRSQDETIQFLATASIAGTIGLLLNATYIDVFVASKVAYTFWAVQGVLMAIFVKEGLVAQNFAFDRQKSKEDVSKLSALLAQTARKEEVKNASGSKYLSSSKKRTKSMKRSQKGR